MRRLEDNPTRRQILLRIDEDIYERISQMSLAQDKSKTLVINELLKKEIYKETMSELFDIANIEIKK